MSVEVGRRAEELAALWLEQHSFTIIERNWRTRWCELDIIAQYQGAIHIIEVKYRSRPDFGTGFEYITPDKILRLQRAATMWLKAHFHNDNSCQIDIISITGPLSLDNVEYLPNAIDGF